MIGHRYLLRNGVKDESLEVPADLICMAELSDEQKEDMPGTTYVNPDLNKIYDWAVQILDCESVAISVNYWSGYNHDTTEIYIWDSYMVKEIMSGLDYPAAEPDMIYFNFDSFEATES